jgi:hypothetical protein
MECALTLNIYFTIVILQSTITITEQLDVGGQYAMDAGCRLGIFRSNTTEYVSHRCRTHSSIAVPGMNTSADANKASQYGTYDCVISTMSLTNSSDFPWYLRSCDADPTNPAPVSTLCMRTLREWEEEREWAYRM